MSFEVRNITNLAKHLSFHKCNPRCFVMVGENKFVCRKPINLKMNNPPANTLEKYQILPNDLSLESLQQLEKVGIFKPLKLN